MADDAGAPDRHGSDRDDDEFTGSAGAADPDDDHDDDDGSVADEGWPGDGAASPLGVDSSNDGPVRGPIG